MAPAPRTDAEIPALAKVAGVMWVIAGALGILAAAGLIVMALSLGFRLSTVLWVAYGIQIGVSLAIVRAGVRVVTGAALDVLSTAVVSLLLAGVSTWHAATTMYDLPVAGGVGIAMSALWLVAGLLALGARTEYRRFARARARA